MWIIPVQPTICSLTELLLHMYPLSYLLRLIVAIVAYVVIGMIAKATVKGARGVEMIPNLNFWKDFPFLLKVNSFI